MDDAIATNDRARYDYELLDKLEAGLVLFGHETKSAKTGHMKLRGAHVAFTRGEAVLHKRQLIRLREKREEEGLTIVPLRAYMKAGRIKIEIAVARGKKTYEKRETIKKRDLDRQVRSALKMRR